MGIVNFYCTSKETDETHYVWDLNLCPLKEIVYMHLTYTVFSVEFSYFKKTPLSGFPKANRDALFSISNKTSVSHTETGVFLPAEVARETAVKLTTHTSLCIQPATSLIMTSATVIMTSSPGGLSAANQTPVATGRHHRTAAY